MRHRIVDWRRIKKNSDAYQVLMSPANWSPERTLECHIKQDDTPLVILTKDEVDIAWGVSVTNTSLFEVYPRDFKLHYRFSLPAEQAKEWGVPAVLWSGDFSVIPKLGMMAPGKNDVISVRIKIKGVFDRPFIARWCHDHGQVVGQAMSQLSVSSR